MQPRSATAILAEIRDGQLIIEASTAILEAVAAVKEFGKPATVSIDLTIKPYSDRNAQLVEHPIIVVGEVTKKLPKPEVPATLFFVQDDGNATRNPPERQQTLGLNVARTGDAKA